METKEFKGKAIYTSGGPASEYGKYSAGFYVGCSNGCTYCYLKTKHPFKYACGGDIPTLKKYFKDEKHALEIFEKELKANLPELQKHGLFFSFTTDPMHCMMTITFENGEKIYTKNVSAMTGVAVQMAAENYVPVKILTKRADFLDGEMNFIEYYSHKPLWKKYVAFGFTLTGRDDLEPNASTNSERIEAIRKLHQAGFKTWASIEPVICIDKSDEIIEGLAGVCDLFKVGLMSGKKYDKAKLVEFIENQSAYEFSKFYFKDSLLKQAGINRSDLPSNCVGRDYSLFNN